MTVQWHTTILKVQPKEPGGPVMRHAGDSHRCFFFRRIDHVRYLFVVSYNLDLWYVLVASLILVSDIIYSFGQV